MQNKFFLYIFELSLIWCCTCLTIACSSNLQKKEGVGSNAIDCMGNTCIAVGIYRTNASPSFDPDTPNFGSLAPLIIRSKDGGKSFPYNSLVALPADASTDENEIAGTFSVSCQSEKCIVVGNYTVKDTGEKKLLAVVSNNRGFSFNRISSITLPQDAIPNNPTYRTGLFGIQCLTKNNCIAVGSYNTAAGPYPLVLVTNNGGESFHPVSVILPEDFVSTNSEPGIIGLVGISCLGANCTAVGGYRTNDGYKPLIVHSTDNGKTFQTLSSIPLPPDAQLFQDADNLLLSINCVQDDCVAVGQYAISESDGGFRPWAVVSKDHGQTFALSSLGNFSSYLSAGKLTGVSCINSNCLAVGNDFTPTFKAEFFMMNSVNGGETFQKVPSAIPPDRVSDMSIFEFLTGLYNVRCTTQNHCLSIGGYRNSDGNFVPIVMNSQLTGEDIQFVPSIALPTNAADNPEIGMLGIFSLVLTTL